DAEIDGDVAGHLPTPALAVRLLTVNTPAPGGTVAGKRALRKVDAVALEQAADEPCRLERQASTAGGLEDAMKDALAYPTGDHPRSDQHPLAVLEAEEWSL